MDNLTKKYTHTELAAIIFFLLMAAALLLRTFFGTEITDEAYYVAEAVSMLHGNLPFAYNTSIMSAGGAFLLIPQIFVYEIFKPDLGGIVLYSRISFSVFKLLVLFMSYCLLKQCIKREHALLISCFMLPFCSMGSQNYSYNTVPSLLVYLIALLLYTAIENKTHSSKYKLIIAGFLTGLSVFAHIGYGVALVCFLMLIFFHSSSKERLINIVSYCLGGIIEIGAVFIPIALQTGIHTIAEGINPAIHPYSSSAVTNTTWQSRFASVLEYSKPLLLIGVLSFAVVFLLLQICVKSSRIHISKNDSIKFAFLISFLVNVFLICKRNSFADSVIPCKLGVLIFVYSIILGITFKLFTKRLFLYLALNPIIFSLGMAIFTDSNGTLNRMYYAIPAFAAVCIFFLETDANLIRRTAAATTLIIALILCVVDCTYVYRDDPLANLTNKVDKGVYAGIYTTENRAKDLPELEQYLNEKISEGEYYAFRDNVPAGYLMVHQGMMCEPAAWDRMQYTYHLNSPLDLFAYYKRRQQIPDKIIYVDFGRDENLSIEDADFKYNEFVNMYYELTDDIELNQTFKHIMVYEYNGKFGKDYQRLIDESS